MAALSPFSDVLSQYCVRSISLPTRSHPSTMGIEQVLTKLQLSGASSSSKAESICTSLSGLQELQKSVQEVLVLEPLTRKTLSSHRLDNLVKLLEESVVYVDVCSNVRDAIMSIKQGVQEVQSALRRRRRKVRGDLSTESIVKAYICTRKNMEKEINKSLTSLKHARNDGKNVRVCPVPDFDEHCHSASKMKFLREASGRTASVLQALVSYLLVPVALRTKRRTRWSLVSNLHKGLVESEGKNDYLNELEEVEVELSHYLCFHHGTITCNDLDSEERIQCLQRKLEALDATFEGLEYEVGILFRGLINTRVSLLNIVSDQ